AFGQLVVERTGLKTLSVQTVNVDTLIAVVAPIPDSLEPRVLQRFGWANDTTWTALVRNAPTQRIALRPDRDRIALTGVRLPAPDARQPGAPTLFAVRVRGRSAGFDSTANGPIAVVQVTDLGVHARIGANDGVVWVTGVNDGMPKQGATVVLHDKRGRVLATSRTDARGLARLGGWASKTVRDTTPADEDFYGGDNEGYVKVTLGDDHALTAVNRWDADLSPWRFNVGSAWGTDRLTVAGAVFTERGIYRPGERVFAKAIIRDGALGSLRAPAAGDSIKWRFNDRDGGVLREITTRLTSFGTSSQSVALPTTAPIGYYNLEVQVFRQGQWQSVAYANYRVAEYRPPEFLVDVHSQEAKRLPGDTFAVNVQARYLFGAPMGRATFTWTARQSPSWSVRIPGIDGWYLGDYGSWWEEETSGGEREFASGTDTLDVRGEHPIKVELPPAVKGRAANVTIQATVFDVNRQVVAASATTLVHPADFYVAVKPRGDQYFWKAGEAQTLDLIAVRPDGQRVPDVRVEGTIVRREWHQVRRERNGVVEVVGDWVQDTVAKCAVVTAAEPVPCAVTPSVGGTYTITFSATDRAGRIASTSFVRWVSGRDWVPWSDESQFKMDVIPDKSRYSVGDTATILFASPFTNAEAWVTVEREGLIEQRRLRITSGSTTLKFPITEAYAPNAFVSIIVARGRSAAPGPLDDPGRPTIRVGYAQLRVTPEVKRLTITLAANKPEYRPGDSVRVNIRVRDALQRTARSEVTLWAVDEGVLSLTAYKTPDP
ncbi:MAG TPA: MG2 domain-containing protein, partial [Gemmatimonadaceae bacterium]